MWLRVGALGPKGRCLMSRPKLSPLSSLLPSKGEATRPEPIATASSSETGEPREHDREQARMQERQLARKQADPRAIDLTGDRPRMPTSRAAKDDYKTGPRSAVSFRMTESLQERLREYAFHTRRKKQDVLDDAVDEFLRRAGY